MLVAAVILCVGSAVGTYAVRAFRASGGQPSFYQSEFGPAVMLACGRGLRNPDTRDVKTLEAFLSEGVNNLDCSDLPRDLQMTDLDPFQRASRYLEATVALTWKLTGISWSRLAALSGVLFGAVAALTYGMFRLALSRGLALLGVVSTLMSTPNLMLAPHLRDYAKGPFLLAVMLIMGVLVVGPTSGWLAIALSASAGLIVGIGLGFRTDLMVAVPPFLFAVAFLIPALSVRLRATAIVAFLAAFAAVAFPLFGDYSHGNNIGPVALLGLTEPFDGPLGIRPSVYEFGGLYNDSLVFSIVNSYVVRVDGRREGVDLATVEHANASMRYLGEIAKTFPADLVVRSLAAIRAVPAYFLQTSLYPPPWVRSSIVRGLYRLRGGLSSRLAFVAVVAVAVVTIGVSLHSPPAAWLIVVLMVGFAGTSAVQFHERHFYYLQFVPWWAFGMIVQAVFRGASGFRTITPRHIRRALTFSVILLFSVGGVLLTARGYQQNSVARLLEAYAAAPRTSVLAMERETTAGRMLLSSREWLDPMPQGSARVETRLIAVRLRRDRCGSAEVPLVLRYQATLPELDFSEQKIVPLGSGVQESELVFVVFDRPDDSSRFRGVELAADQAPCVAGLFRIEGLGRTPLLLTTLMAAGWRNEVLFQRLR